MSGKRSRRKGHAFEREVAAMMSSDFQVDCRRGLQTAGAHVPDVITPLLWVECKVGRSPRLMAALEQAEGDCHRAGGGRVPVALVRFNSTGGGRAATDVALMGLEDFRELLRDAWAWRMQS